MASTAVERTGIVVDETTGEAYLPATQRPDGTWRKPRKVKDGYVPQEEMPTYENKGVQWLKSKPSLPPGLSPADVEAPKTTNDPVDQNLSKAAKKNLKRKEKKKQQQQTQPPQPSRPSVQTVTHSLATAQISSNSDDSSKAKDKPGEKSVAKTDQNDTQTVQQEIKKKIRNLRKKLKQIEDVETKIKSGEIKEPQKEQLEKIAKKNTIESEIEDLELELDDD